MTRILKTFTLNRSLWTRKQIALLVVILTLAPAAAYLSVSLVRSRPVTSVVLSDQWKCTKTAGILTVCIKKPG
ncbi:MAG: hypothetical protein KGK01_04950 [Bradyrhizobium sp.]|uniref:hypothetical protein n=1 Tax=Bradyrhizobium sp. TaxID=376 RepID=UPI001C29834D|nr:hypothetical protein [Bradyrhizobium sp.]MBU6461243.1 hypothetical protein [Pseudomonadota bacterium]MDE2065726.1 hypothetical protein [Bradyrhizobium sp.]MDE2241803.1 hypothetical protein [Bradyrhizobium sp.]MDE2471532.1 hypothetical protein [Bradyrhizobium sp.]